MSAIFAPSIATRVPPRIVEPRSTAAFTTGVAAETPGIDRNAPPRAHAGMSLPAPGDIRTSEPAVHAAWSAWLCVQVAAWADANVPRAAARIRSSAARVYRSGRRATWRLPSEAMRPRVRASPRSASSARRGTIRIASTAPPTRPIAGAATSSGSTPSVPRALRVSVAPYSRSWSMAITASTISARSSPSRCGSVRPAWRPMDARTPAMLTPVRSVGIVSAIRAMTAPRAAVAKVVGPGSGAVSPTPSIAGLSRTACTSSTASHGAAIAAGTTTSSASPNAIAARCPVPAPRDRSRAVSLRRRSSSRAATRITAYAASTPNWTSSSRIPAWATSTERSTEARISGSLVATDAWFEPGRAAFTRPASPRTSAATASSESGSKPLTSGIARHCASSGSLRTPPVRSASATTSGPRVVNRPLVSLPSIASGSASQ